MKTIILTGGGTAGHIMPNLALLPELSKHFDKICYIGSKSGMENEIISKQKNIKFYDIPTVKFVRSLTLKNLLIPFKLIKAVKCAKKIIKQLNPDVIFSKGGYVSMPVAIAGKKLGIPVISHESDLSMGLANKIILKYSKKVCVTFPKTAEISPKCIFTGTPIRKQIFCGNKNLVINNYKLNCNLRTIMFFGGSLGAKKINEEVFKIAEKLCKNYNVIHIVGKKNLKELKINNYIQIEFTDKIEDFFACADFVVCRAGANAIMEVLSLNKPMLLIPLGKNESRGDQLENAEYFKSRNFAEVLSPEDLNDKNLENAIFALIAHSDSIKKSQKDFNLPDANKKIVKIICENIKK